MKHYHYIFTGSGLSALMTIYEMVLSGKFDDKTILLIDSDSKKNNDRTWCFWDEENLFDEIVSKKWNSALFADSKFDRELNLEPYQYKMIKGLDFYKSVFDRISKQQNIHFANQKVLNFQELGNHCVVKTDVESYTCNKIFNSIFNPELVKNQNKYPFLHQHFIGWFIKSKEAVFNVGCATFMDFSVEQKGNTRFMYVLPTSQTEALIEYTLFSKDLLAKDEYETEIQNYINQLGITNYELREKEQGNIPMTSYKFWKNNTKNIINIGSAGGWTKASTGFTFKNTIKKSKALVRFLENGTSTSLSVTDFRKFYKQDKFWFYDLLFLDVLNRRNDKGSEVFSSLFKKGNPTLIFKFLDEETSFSEDLKVIWKCPKGLFIRALLQRFIGLR
ncbi:MAG TPA: lycopene cyclase family protein [Flavobacterium sp.]|uniref:lycopene cyclase family protein n=1 Tax=Flavobacterium sp. TaxID=239 RepID=UPI002CC3D32C|nr:lycopene cyclase family protein [Flavobacterium sp.]HNP31820.1 lycopene cyclase family protein [Flavobacterium sp.]